MQRYGVDGCSGSGSNALPLTLRKHNHFGGEEGRAECRRWGSRGAGAVYLTDTIGFLPEGGQEVHSCCVFAAGNPHSRGNLARICSKTNFRVSLDDSLPLCHLPRRKACPAATTAAALPLSAPSPAPAALRPGDPLNSP